MLLLFSYFILAPVNLLKAKLHNALTFWANVLLRLKGKYISNSACCNFTNDKGQWNHAR